MSFVKSLMYGGMDGIITMFNIIASTTGANISSVYTIIISLTVLIADALSMGISDYMSYEAEQKANHNKENKSPIYHGLVTFLSFMIFGAIPLILYVILGRFYKKQLFVVLFLCMTVAFAILGALRSKLTNERWYHTSGKMILLGNGTSILAYLISNNLTSFIKK